MKKIQYFVALMLLLATNSAFAVTHHIYITSSGASPKYTTVAYEDTVFIHATPTYPVQSVQRTYNAFE